MRISQTATHPCKEEVVGQVVKYVGVLVVVFKGAAHEEHTLLCAFSLEKAGTAVKLHPGMGRRVAAALHQLC